MSKARLLFHILGLAHILTLASGCSMAFQTASAGDPTVEQASASDATPSASSASSSGEYACEPTAGSLEADATLADRAGRYHLVLVADSSGAVADSNSAATHAISGMLILRRHPMDPDLTDSPDSTDAQSYVSTTLYGFTDVDPEMVGAHRVGDPGSKDPSAPGVLVLERAEYGRRVITLRLGSEANRKDLVRYDGTYTALSVSKIDEEGFAGSWRSGGGPGFSVITGFFCAWKVR